MEETPEVKWNRGLDLFIESVHKPDHELRQCAHNQNRPCFALLRYFIAHVSSPTRESSVSKGEEFKYPTKVELDQCKRRMQRSSPSS